MNYYARYFRRITKGERAIPRGMTVSQLHNVLHAFIPGDVIRRPHDNPAIGFTELIQLIAGDFDRYAFAKVAPNARLDLFTPQMAYGPRTVGQFDKVIWELRHDEWSRRAVVFVGRPEDPYDELPCTISMQFQLTKMHGMRTLTGTFNMRSSDTIWGLPYDIIQFGGVTQAVGNVIGVPATQSIVSIANAHVYDSTKPADPKFDENWMFDMPFRPEWRNYVDWARMLMAKMYDRSTLEKEFNLRQERRTV